MVNEHTVDNYPSPLGLTSRIRSLIFWCTSEGFISPTKTFVEFSLKFVYPAMVEKTFKFIVFRFLENAFVSQKLESISFYSCPRSKNVPQVLIITPIQREITSFTQAEVFENLQLEGAGNCERTEKVAKI